MRSHLHELETGAPGAAVERMPHSDRRQCWLFNAAAVVAREGMEQGKAFSLRGWPAKYRYVSFVLTVRCTAPSRSAAPDHCDG